MFNWLIPLLVFLAAFLAAMELQIRWRSARRHGRVRAITGISGPGKFRQEVDKKLFKPYFFKMISILAAFQVKWVPEAWGNRVRKEFAQIPEWKRKSAAEWLVLKELSSAAGLAFGWALGLDLALTILLGAGAFFIPELWLKDQVRIRRQRIMRELPASLDLLAACLEAGLGFEPALAVLLERSRSGPMREEFAELARGLAMGLARRDAMAAMAIRVDTPDFSLFVNAVIQAERLGVSVAAALKQQAGLLRVKRGQMTEKMALEAPVKLLFPLIVFIFPVVFLMLFGPILIRFMQGF